MKSVILLLSCLSAAVYSAPAHPGILPANMPQSDLFHVGKDGTVKGGINLTGSSNSANSNGLALNTDFAQSVNFQKNKNGQLANQNTGSVGVNAAINIPAYKQAEALAQQKQNVRKPREP